MSISSEPAPQDILNDLAKKWQLNFTSEEFARELDRNDPLNYVREEFYYPMSADLPDVDKSCIDCNSQCIYLCGHSLGLQSKRVRKWIDMWLNDWATLGVCANVKGSNPFADADYQCIPTLSKLVGAKIEEVAVMNQLTSNINFLLISFYRPTSDRYKILFEQRAFPSDEYAINSHIRLHSLDPTTAKMTIRPRQNETYIRTEDILQLLKEQGESIALVLFSGIQFYTGQLFDIKTITHAAQQYGCTVGWDLAHVVGNVPVKLHEWNVDFAVWCSYKYLNGGYGAIGGVFVHSNHFEKDYPRLDGWWGNRIETRFNMRSDIDRDRGANGFRVSCPSIHQCATLAGSLELFAEIGIEKLRRKSKLLTQYLQTLLEIECNQSSSDIQIQILTPTDPEQRGAQLSFRILNIDARQVHLELTKLGVIFDVRDDVLRATPAPLYNSFLDIYRFVTLLKTVKRNN